MQDFKSGIDALLAAFALFTVALTVFGGEKRKAVDGGLHRGSLTFTGWSTIGAAGALLVLALARIVVAHYDKVAQDADKRATAARAQGLTDTIDRLNEQVGPFVEMATARFKGVETDESLKALADEFIANETKVSSLEGKVREQENLRSHEMVARWGFDGMASFSGGVARIATPLVGWAKGRIKLDGNKVTFLCDHKDVEGYRRAIKQEPRFPLPYCALAACLSRQNDPSWKNVAEKGITILELTTKVPDHDPDHDTALAMLRELMLRK